MRTFLIGLFFYGFVFDWSPFYRIFLIGGKSLEGVFISGRAPHTKKGTRYLLYGSNQVCLGKVLIIPGEGVRGLSGNLTGDMPSGTYTYLGGYSDNFFS